MDEEDLADAAEHERVQTAATFAGIGSTEEELAKRGAFIDLFKAEGETIGVKLLKRMGWREGQGVGPKVRRAARLERSSSGNGEGEQHLFAPENTKMISFVRKNDHKGLGFAVASSTPNTDAAKVEGEDVVFGTAAAKATATKKKKTPVRGGIGIGILNDTGSDDEDPYEIGPKIAYNRVIGGEKKKKNVVANGALKPIFISKKAAAARAGLGLRKCHDGRLPLDGFILSSLSDSAIASTIANEKYRPPEVPEGWKSSKTPTSTVGTNGYVSTADAARSSALDPRSRAALLGETPLPGKSVFDFLTAGARERIAAATGKSNLPAALGEVPEGYTITPEQKQAEVLAEIPKVDKMTAVAALGRGSNMPYADDEPKRGRYRKYLETQADVTRGPLERSPGVSKDDWLKELKEFALCSKIFRPMTGMMATRFTTSSSSPSAEGPLLRKPEPKPEDPAEAAAKIGMFGRMTRSEEDFFPTKLLCKRFGVAPPLNIAPDQDGEGGPSPAPGPEQPISRFDIDDLVREAAQRYRQPSSSASDDNEVKPARAHVVIDVEHNDALGGVRAGEDVFQSIFGDDSE